MSQSQLRDLERRISELEHRADTTKRILVTLQLTMSEAIIILKDIHARALRAKAN